MRQLRRSILALGLVACGGRTTPVAAGMTASVVEPAPAVAAAPAVEAQAPLNTLTLLVLRADDPDALSATTAASRREQTALTRTFPSSPGLGPLSIFMRALDLDLWVFQNDEGKTEVMMIDGGSLADHSVPILQQHLGAGVDDTVAKLQAWGRSEGLPAVTDDELREALASGTWPAKPSPLLEAAAFARQLVQASEVALPSHLAVVWEIRPPAP